MGKVVVKAIGEPCPVPVVKAMKALREMKEPGLLEVHVDSEIAVQNLQRMASGKKLGVKSEKVNDKHFVVTLTVDKLVESGEMPDIRSVPAARGEAVAAIGAAAMGSGSEELGKILMKGFIYAVSQLEELPRTMLFYNGGAFLTTEGSASLEDIEALEAQGVEILTCGTCLDYYGLREKLAVGSVTNMYDIAEKLCKATKVIRP